MLDLTEANIDDSVIVNEPAEDDDWSHSFKGQILDIIEQASGEQVFIIQDEDDDEWQMEREKFRLEDED